MLRYSLFLITLIAFAGCRSPQVSSSPTPRESPPTPIPGTKKLSHEGASPSQSGGTAVPSGEGPSGDGGPTGLPASRPGRTEGEGSGPSRAEVEAEFKRTTNTFSSEASLNKNPSQARAKATPKSFDKMVGMNGYDVVSEKSQPASSAGSRESGRALYRANCRRCHGDDAKLKEENGGLGRYNMANLSDPMQYKYGADGPGIFRSIAFGTPAPPHGSYNGILSDTEIWNIVAYIQSSQVQAR